MPERSESGPEAPRFRALLGKQSVTVVYDSVEHAVVALDDRDRVMARAKVMRNHPPIEVSDGTFHWNTRRLQPVDYDYGLAVAFAHFVNGRRARSAAKNAFGDPIDGGLRWQYGVVNIGTFGSAERMSEALASTSEPQRIPVLRRYQQLPPMPAS